MYPAAHMVVTLSDLSGLNQEAGWVGCRLKHLGVKIVYANCGEVYKKRCQRFFFFFPPDVSCIFFVFIIVQTDLLSQRDHNRMAKLSESLSG